MGKGSGDDCRGALTLDAAAAPAVSSEQMYDRVVEGVLGMGLPLPSAVGGCERDRELGKAIKDVDVMVAGVTPAELLELCRKHGNADPLEVDGRMIGVRLTAPWTPKEGIEIALARTERSTGLGFHDFEIVPIEPPAELLALPIAERAAANPQWLREAMLLDLERRDFTCNAIAKVMGSGETLDPYGGVADIRAGVIRAVSKDTFRDDPLRSFRLLARMAKDGSRPDPETDALLREAAPKLRPIDPDVPLSADDELLLRERAQARVSQTLMRRHYFDGVQLPPADGSPEERGGFLRQAREQMDTAQWERLMRAMDEDREYRLEGYLVAEAQLKAQHTEDPTGLYDAQRELYTHWFKSETAPELSDEQKDPNAWAPQTLAHAAKEFDLYRTPLAQERIQAELEKTLSGRHAAAALRYAREVTLLETSMPELKAAIGFDQESKYHNLTADEHILEVVGRACEFGASREVRWAALLHDAGKPASAFRGKDGRLHFYARKAGTAVEGDPVEQALDFERVAVKELGKQAGRKQVEARVEELRAAYRAGDIQAADLPGKAHEVLGAEIAVQALDRLRCDADTRKKVKFLVAEHMFRDDDKFAERSPEDRAKKARKFIARVGRDNVADLLMLRRCDRAGKRYELTPGWDDEISLFETEVRAQMHHPLTVKELAVNGRDLQKLGFKGPAMGVALRELLHRVVLEPEANRPEQLLKWAGGLAKA